ncbi:MAG: hypothetical protein ACFFDT_22105 [Candidatus Hodarchaeota archaeon]
MSQKDRSTITRKMANVLSHSSSDRVDTIVDEMIELRRKECDECQSNKVLCILQPKCGPNRDFLDILIGIDYKDIPKFCYSQRIREMKRRLDLDEEIPSGTKIYLSDYLVLNGLKRRRTVTLEELESIDGFIAGTDLRDSWVVLIKNNLIVVDVEAGTVTFNPWDFQVSGKNFESFAKLLIKRYDFLDLHRLVEEYMGLWILEVKTRIPQSDVTTLDDAIKKSYHLLAYELEEPDLLRLIAEIQLTRRRGASILASQRYESTISLGNLRDAIEEVATVARNLQVLQVPSE